ncbi:hypothetical protein HW053_001473 [Campylobacter jejuni]|uniref:hypothetical protein n=1 Tax=Campylobacter jejuni TaxID=197 RepID=UPI00073DECC4|nr:hypothetical protein [Campylobacter jejuni]ALW15619.1 hypothetical protein RC26_02700 [Campylobacter jejuni]EFS7927391.1 hypothetical protein [Campylobacter jejuni]MBX1020865.1 hypothetical protein [Campylobacter jejuni]HED5364342.1 hypothetical protein [Campylobacter jejuni]
MWKLIKKFFKYLIMFYIAIFVIIFVAFCSDDTTRQVIKNETDKYNPVKQIENLRNDLNEVKDIEKKSKEILEKYQN